MHSFYKKIPLFVFTIITNTSTLFHAAQPAAGAGWQAQSMQEKIAAFDKKFAACRARYVKELQEKQKKIMQLNERLRKMNDYKEYEQRKSIIKAAIEKDHIHPRDIIADEPFSCLVCEAADRNDAPFVHFLLQNHADPNKLSNGYGPVQAPALAYARNILIAQTLVAAGASLKKYGVRALSQVVSYNDADSADLVKWYLDRGVPANDSYDDYTPLYLCLGHHPNTVQFLLQEGALLSFIGKGTEVGIHYGYNIPQVVKSNEKSGESSYANSIKRLMKEHSAYRHDGILQDLALCKGSENKPLLAPLCALVVNYYVQAEPTYEALEQIPLPDNLWHQWQRQMLARRQQT